MNDGISLIELILNASFAVQLVMFVLFLLSIISWVIIVQRWLVLSAASKGVFGFEQRFWSGMDLSQLYKEGTQMQQENIQVVGMENIFRAGFKEFMRLRQQGSIDGEAVMEGAQRAMRVAYSRGRKAREEFTIFSHRWLCVALCRIVRDSYWNYECVLGASRSSTSNFAGCCSRNCGSVVCNRHGLICCYPGGGGIQ